MAKKVVLRVLLSESQAFKESRLDNIKRFKQFFDTDQGKKCYARLLLHAGDHLRRYQMGTGKNLALTPEDAVNETIRLVLDGTRKWDNEKHSNIENYLKWNIRSVIDHSFDTVDSTQTARYPEDDKGNEYIPSPEHSEINDFTESIRTQTPEEIILSEKEFTEFNAKILAGFVEYPEIEDLILCIIEGVSKPQEIAKELKIPVSEVNNRKKRLRRILRKIYSKP